MIWVIIIITALSGLIATIIYTLAEFIDRKIRGGLKNFAYALLVSKIIRKDVIFLTETEKKVYDGLGQLLYGIIWSAPIPLLFFFIQPTTGGALTGLVLLYFLIFLILDAVIFSSLKILPPLRAIPKREIVSSVVTKLIYCLAGVFTFIIIAYLYISPLIAP